jgi:hypothetical protein
MTPEPDVTLSVTMSAEAFRSFREERSEPCAMPWRWAALNAFDDAILAAPLPPPPTARMTWLSICSAHQKWNPTCENCRIGRFVDDPPPPPPMKEPERGDVVTWYDGHRSRTHLIIATRDGHRMKLLADDEVWTADFADITENHGPPEGDEWNGWEVGK